MQDQQVEVVPGPHAAARVAGAVVLVVHRGPGRPTADSPAVRALVSLAELVYEATARHPDGPGAAIAREATRWLTARAERTTPGTSVDFGILSAAGPDRVAIFLHGAVTAVVAGENTEYFHGRDAVFTVDRAVAVPSRAVALFADDPLVTADDAAEPELPGLRGIGRLVEGIAEAHAVIAWSPPDRRAAADRGPGAVPSAGRRGVVLGKPADTAEAGPVRDDRETQPSARQANSSSGVTPTAPEAPHRAPVSQAADAPASAGGERPGHGISPRRPDPDDVVTATASSAVDSVQLSEQATLAADADSNDPAGGRAGGAQAPAADPHHAETEVSGRQPPESGEASRAGQGPGPARGAPPGPARGGAPPPVGVSR
ncbi:hypothetical protein, partial [Nocardia carnea]|uniref:hypothetical protein n=1 Tax=Nocardia carnea TaxID=37328 RepID=UPI002453F0F7